MVGHNLTTGLLSYRVQQGLADEIEGESPDTIQAPQPDWQVAADNPELDRLQALQEGQKVWRLSRAGWFESDGSQGHG